MTVTKSDSVDLKWLFVNTWTKLYFNGLKAKNGHLKIDFQGIWRSQILVSKGWKPKWRDGHPCNLALKTKQDRNNHFCGGNPRFMWQPWQSTWTPAANDKVSAEWLKTMAVAAGGLASPPGLTSCLWMDFRLDHPGLQEAAHGCCWHTYPAFEKPVFTSVQVKTEKDKLIWGTIQHLKNISIFPKVICHAPNGSFEKVA